MVRKLLEISSMRTEMNLITKCGREERRARKGI